MTITWSDDLETGIAIIDEQHHRLFETIGKLDKFKDNENVFYDILINLMNYMTIHFKTEQDFMLNTNYSDLKHHKNCHDEFVNEFKKFLDKVSPNMLLMDIAPEVIKYAEEWITGHYANEDLKMAKYLRSTDNIKLIEQLLEKIDKQSLSK